MYRKSKIYFLGCLTILLMHACSNTDGLLEEPTITDKINFISTIDNNNFGGTNTKAINSSWDAQDEIGVFMYQDGKELQENTIVNEIYNHVFTTTGNGTFTTQEGKEVFFPKDVEKVNFIAYYPYDSEIKNFEKVIDVAEQSNPAKINLMYSNNLKGNSANTSRVLQFKHILSRVQFDIKTKQNVNLAGLSIEINDVPVKAALNLVDGSLKIDNTSTQASVVAYKESDERYSAFLLPTESSSIKFTIRIRDKVITKTINTANLNSGKQNVITLSLSDSGGEVIPEKTGWSETPLFKTTDKQEYITFNMPANAGPYSVKHRNYSMLYDKSERVALWVAYPLHSSHMGSAPRSKWSYAPGLAQSEQPNVVSKSWPNEADVHDRGHQIASSDRTVTSDVNAMTFYVTNTTVQRISLNGGVWNKLEDEIQQQAKTMGRDTIYIVTGVTLTSKNAPTKKYTKDLSGNNVIIPATYYKAIYRKVNGKDVTYGYSFPNIETSKGENFNDSKYKISVSQLEQETGYTFFPDVAKAVKDQVVEI